MTQKTTKRDVVFIHGTWANGPDVWGEMAPELEKRGYRTHTPTLRHHDRPLLEGAEDIATLSLLDYVDDLSETVRAFDAPPLIIGSSMGGLLAQLVAARNPHVGVILLAPAPAAGMFGLYPSIMKIFIRHFAQTNFWRKPLMPEWETFRWGVANEQNEADARKFFDTLCAESGRAYAEMALWFLDRRQASRVHTQSIGGPVLVFGGGKDRVIPERIARLTAERYENGSYVRLPKSDHMMMMGAQLGNTMRYIDAWLGEVAHETHCGREAGGTGDADSDQRADGALRRCRVCRVCRV